MRATAFVACLALASTAVATPAPDSLDGPQAAPRPGCFLSNKKLSRCLDTAARRTQDCGEPTSFRKGKALCLCRAYTDAAACWAHDECAEWHPTIVAADKVCAISKRKASTATSKLFRTVVNEAASLADAIAKSGGGSAHLPKIINALDHKFRPRVAHKAARKKRPFGVEAPLDDIDGAPLDDIDESALLILQGVESIFEYLPEYDDDGSEITSVALFRRHL